MSSIVEAKVYLYFYASCLLIIKLQWHTNHFIWRLNLP